MGSTKSLIEKRDFLRWFLNVHELKRRECAWLLNYLISEDTLLEKVHIVEKAEFCPKALVISANDVDHIPFSFHKNQHVTMNAERSFHDIRLNPDEDIYLQLNFQDSKGSHKYISVLEENPYLPNRTEENVFFRLMAEIITEEAVRSFRLQSLKVEIDEALLKKDRDSFERLSLEMIQLKRK
ncbi:ReoY family proteolytic degradation factor [Thalassorhabdus alkalitolerans]|uniref:UPF0302 protein ACFPU1_15905 n=1 Tax=Thalassorhabdus alkalitolerans TaxID=2282697 RepID=A0ABW0YP33_9BACI|nr:ReoY family proteolytic degradation factor [Thalassobacillus sp. C254]